jgi:hypothetical protein
MKKLLRECTVASLAALIGMPLAPTPASALPLMFPAAMTPTADKPLVQEFPADSGEARRPEGRHGGDLRDQKSCEKTNGETDPRRSAPPC